MRYVNDEFTQFYSSDIGWTPATVESAVKLKDPLINAEIESMINEAALMGIDVTNPIAMAGLMDTITKKIQQVSKYVTGGKDIAIQTDKGTTVIGPGGVSYVSKADQTAVQQQPESVSDMIQRYLKNPYVVAGLVGIPLLMILMNKRRNRK